MIFIRLHREPSMAKLHGGALKEADAFQMLLQVLQSMAAKYGIMVIPRLISARVVLMSRAKDLCGMIPHMFQSTICMT